MIRPENDDPLSMLLTLQQFDGQKISDDEKAEKDKWDAEDKDRKNEIRRRGSGNSRTSRHHGTDRPTSLTACNLRTANWTLVKTGDKNVAKFRYTLPEKDLEITKTYRLAEVPAESQKDESYQGYHLEFEIEIRNISKEPGESHKVAYRLDGPNGLPTEGGLVREPSDPLRRNRDSASSSFRWATRRRRWKAPLKIAGGKDLPVRPDTPPDKMLTFIGVDAQYFSAVLMPERENPAEVLVRGVDADLRRQGRSETAEADEHVVPAGEQSEGIEAGRDAYAQVQVLRRPEEGRRRGALRSRRIDLFRLADLSNGSPCR